MFLTWYIYILYKIPRIPNFFIYSWAPAQRVVPRCSQVFAEKNRISLGCFGGSYFFGWIFVWICGLFGHLWWGEVAVRLVQFWINPTKKCRFVVAVDGYRTSINEWSKQSITTHSNQIHHKDPMVCRLISPFVSITWSDFHRPWKNKHL